ncbi:MAG: hypothetical protein DCC75_04565, partial [Proteobacteria bacterium]
MPYFIDYEIQDSEIEAHYKHVHHATTVRLLELGRLKLLEHLGKPLDYWIGLGFYLVITDLAVSFRREIFDGVIKIGCYRPRVEDRLVSVSQVILR